MPTLAETVYGTLAACNVTGGNPPSYAVQRGFNAAMTRNGAGDYTQTLDPQGAALSTESVVMATARLNAINALIGVEPLTTTTLRVRAGTSIGGVFTATDLSYSLEISKISPN